MKTVTFTGRIRTGRSGFREKPVRSRNQLLLDFSRKEVRDCVFDQICVVLDQGKLTMSSGI